MEGKGTVRIVSAGKIPVIEYKGSPDGLRNFSCDALKNPYSADCSLDLAFRLASNDLVLGEKKRGIIYLSCGDVGVSSFSKYGLSNLTTYMNNNSISLSVIQLSQKAVAEEIQYICDYTAGTSYYIYRPEGISSVIKDIIELPSGVYQLSYKSSLPSNLGRAYLPVEAEVYLMNRSGVDETGYFAPLQ